MQLFCESRLPDDADNSNEGSGATVDHGTQPQSLFIPDCALSKTPLGGGTFIHDR